MIKNRTFLLLVANALLACFIFLSMEDDSSSIADIESHLSEMISQMDEITFGHPARSQQIILRKRQAGWYVIEPVSWPAEPVTLANLASKISHLEPVFVCSVNELVSKGEIPEDYGFNENSSSLRLSGRNKLLKFILGDITRDQNGRFLMIDSPEGKGIWRVPRPFESLLNSPTLDWAMLSFFNQIVSEKLSGFSEIQPDQSLPKLFDISVQAMGETRTLTLYNSSQGEVPELLASISGKTQVFRVQSEFAEVFENLSTKLRERRLFSVEVEQVSRVKMVEGNNSLTLRKSENNSWIGLEDDGNDSFTFQASLPHVVEFIHKLNAVEVKDFIMFNPDQSALNLHGFDKPQLRLEIEHKDTTRQNILISKSNDESFLWNTYFTDQALICLVNTQWNKLLSTRAVDFKKRELLPDQFLPDRIILKSLIENETLQTFSYESDGEAYDRIKGFQADSFIELAYNKEGVWVEGDWLPWKYSIVFESNDEKGIKAIIFNLTDRFGATKWFAGSEELGLVCNLPISVIDELSKGLISKPLGP